ncbi:MAG: hypothetical protein ACE5ID_08305 [Acidobacteriota bacterium]
MKRVMLFGILLALVPPGAPGGQAQAHMTPTVELVGKDAVLRRLLPGSSTFQARELILSREEIKSVRRSYGLRWPRDPVRFYRGEDAEGSVLGIELFTTADSPHGPVEMAVALDSSGRLTGFKITRVNAEILPWIRALERSSVLEGFKGAVASDLAGPEDLPLGDLASLGRMERFYAQVVREAVFKALILSRWIHPREAPAP